LIAVSTERRLRFLFHEGLNDPDLRKDLRSSLGFCGRHAAEAARIGHPLGIALLYNDVLARAKERVGALASGRRVSALAPCPQCIAEQKDEEHYIRALATDLQEESMQVDYERAYGLCFSHLEAVIAQASEEVSSFLGAQEDTRLSDLIHDLQEFIRKSDYRFSREPMGAEGNSWRRALEKVAGSLMGSQRGCAL
jgi:hypothetical protein